MDLPDIFFTSLRCLVFFPAASTSMMHGASYIVHYTIKPIYRQRQFCPSRPMTLDDFSSFYSSTIKARSLETNTIKSRALCIAKTSLQAHPCNKNREKLVFTKRKPCSHCQDGFAVIPKVAKMANYAPEDQWVWISYIHIIQAKSKPVAKS